MSTILENKMGFKKRPAGKKWFLNIDVETGASYTRAPDPDDSWDIGDEHITFIGVTAVRSENKWSGYSEENVPEDGETVYVLVECYSHGCTFGVTNNDHHHIGWYRTYAEAEKASETTPKNNDYFGGGHEYWHIEPVVVGRKLRL